MYTENPVSLNLNVRGLQESATLAIKARCRALRARGAEVFDFGLGQSPFPVPEPVVAALREAAPEKDYLPVAGLPALRSAIADFHTRRDDVPADPDRVIVGPGSKELMFILQLVFYGEILIPTPCWVSYQPQAQIIGRRVSVIATSSKLGWKLTPEQLADSLSAEQDRSRPRLLVLNYPSNPVGNTYTADELAALAAVAREYKLLVLSDEIYGQLHHRGEHVSLARFYPEGTIRSSGLSKWCGAGGWRLGTFVFPESLAWLHQAMAAVASETFTSVCAPVQYAAVPAFVGGPEIERYLRQSRRILRALGARCTRMLRDAGIELPEAEGGFYLFLDFGAHAGALAERGIRTSAQLCERLLQEAQVAVLPGSAFARPSGELTARLSYVDFDGAAALRACAAFAPDVGLPDEFLERYCGSVVRGVQRIAEWVQQGSALAAEVGAEAVGE